MDIIPIAQTQKSLGGELTLTNKDLKDLSVGTCRVAELMSDGCWHYPQAIRRAASDSSGPASEGLRRMRELRAIDEVRIEKKRVGGTRLWMYRLVRGVVETEDKVQRSLF